MVELLFTYFYALVKLCVFGPAEFELLSILLEVIEWVIGIGYAVLELFDQNQDE